MCGLLFRNPLIPAAVVFVWENLNPFLPDLLKKISIIFYLKSLCPVEVPVPPPFSVMVVESDRVPYGSPFPVYSWSPPSYWFIPPSRRATPKSIMGSRVFLAA